MRNIVLIGFMGCGKTTMGIKLSYKLHRIMEDTDKWIERNEGCTIREIFSTKGEEAFRRIETACIKKMAEDPTVRIISTGGGLPVREENWGPLKKLGHVVYLKISPGEAYDRLKEDTERPLLQCEDPYGRICELLDKREPLYEACADTVILVDGKTVEEVLDEMLTILKEKDVI